jgi:plasmid stabilization system protein ParE
MTFQLRILPRAEGDVQHIFDYIHKRSPDGAVRWWEAFQLSAQLAAMHPFRYALSSENVLSSMELRQFLFKTRRGRTYRAVFVVVGDEVRILRVRGPGQAPLTPEELGNE